MKMTFILIDDDPILNLIHRKIIESSHEGSGLKIMSFLCVREALDFIKECSKCNSSGYLIFLDINMPGLNGWDFLDQIEKFPGIWNNIYILSSSVAKSDLEKAEGYKSVKGYLTKPLSVRLLQSIVQEQAVN